MTIAASQLPARETSGQQAERIGALFDRCHGRLWALARRMSGDAEEARDLVQEAFLRAARRPAGLPADDEGAEAWLVRVLINLCRDRRRRVTVRRHHALAVKAATRPAAPPDPESAALARTSVQRALGRLTVRRRAVVVLAELQGLDTREIGALLGLSRVTVRWHLSRARRELLALLAPECVPRAAQRAPGTAERTRGANDER